MKPIYEDLTGQRFGMLTAIKRVETEKKYKSRGASWLCKCDCGNEKIVLARSLKTGGTKTCGHHNTGKNGTNYRHGYTGTRLSIIYHQMKQRCNNPKAIHYDYYGGRGIKVCPEWNCSDGLKAFGDWAIENGYQNGLTLDRINSNGNYEPANCRWIPFNEQQKNMRNNIHITYNGKTMILSEWAKKTGISYSTLQSRIRRGKSVDDLLRGYTHEISDNKVCEMA